MISAFGLFGFEKLHTYSYESPDFYYNSILVCFSDYQKTLNQRQLLSAQLNENESVQKVIYFQTIYVLIK